MKHRPQQGFTLVEVLVALLVMALLAVMAWQGVDGVVRTRDASQTKLDQMLRVNTALAQWEEDLFALQDTSIAPALSFDGATLRLIRHTDKGVEVVAWSLRDGAWWRWAGPPVTGTHALQNEWLASQQLLGNEPGHLRVLNGVASWQIYFYRGNSWSNAQSSGDVVQPADAAASGAPVRQALPKGVRAVMTFREGGPLAGQFTRDLMLVPHLQP